MINDYNLSITLTEVALYSASVIYWSCNQSVLIDFNLLANSIKGVITYLSGSLSYTFRHAISIPRDKKYYIALTYQLTFTFSRYLLNNHRDVTISDLQSGVSYLEVECGTHTSSDIEFVKTHIDVLLACHDTLQKVWKY